MRGKKAKQVDPLFQLFEHHLIARSYDDSGAFTKEVAEGYIAYLDSTAAHIPLHVRQAIQEDLEAEAHEMLVKKMYGCVQQADYENFGRVVRVNSKDLSTFEFQPSTTQPTPEENTEEK